MSARPGMAQNSHKKPRPRQSLDWQEQAVCVEHDPEMFFDPERYEQALQVCAACPVKAPCRRLGQGLGPGVWGGRVQHGKPQEAGGRLFLLKPHGTEAAYARHRRAGEEPCELCRKGDKG